MNNTQLERGVLLTLTGRSPGDAIVQATLVQQLRVINFDPVDVVVAHASPSEPQSDGWFTDVRHCSKGNFVVRHIALLRIVVKLLRSGSISAVYARDVVTMQVALVARWLAHDDVPIIFDCRGDIAAEAQLRGTARLRVAILKRMQKLSWNRADRVMVVSESLRNLVSESAPRTPAIVVPNLQPQSLPVIDEMRPRPLVVFAGGGQKWQDIGRVMRDLAGLRQSGIDVEVVTRDGGLIQHARALGFEVSSGGRAHVLSRLQHATASWMVRADAAANSVASPVKLGEALSAGTVVVGSQATWEHMPELVMDQLAIVVKPDGDTESLVSDLFGVWAQGPVGRARRLEAVQRNWTLGSYRGELERFFGLRIGYVDE